MSGTKAQLTFEGLDFNNYYPVPAGNYNGYEGFNFVDMGLLTGPAIQWLGYGDETGYSNVLNGTTCAFTYFNHFGNGSGFGEIVSSYAGETFNLKSGIFASAWCSSQPVYFEAVNKRGHITASLDVSLHQVATTIDFSNYGHEFSHISGLRIVSEPGQYGVQGFKGYQIAMDNIDVRWNGPIPHAHQARAHIAPQAMAALAEHAADTAHQQHTAGGHDTGLHYQSVLDSLSAGHDGGGGLTSQFSLPEVDHHFGT
jgi:hypothetical protein